MPGLIRRTLRSAKWTMGMMVQIIAVRIVGIPLGLSSTIVGTTQIKAGTARTVLSKGCSSWPVSPSAEIRTLTGSFKSSETTIEETIIVSALPTTS